MRAADMETVRPGAQKLTTGGHLGNQFVTSHPPTQDAGKALEDLRTSLDDGETKDLSIAKKDSGKQTLDQFMAKQPKKEHKQHALGGELATTVMDQLELTHPPDFDIEDEDCHLDIYAEPTLLEHGFAKVLAYYNMNYSQEYQAEESRQRLQAPNRHRDYLQSEEMKATVTAQFETFVHENGFLTPEVIQAELDNVCWIHKRQPWHVLNTPNIGPLLKGLLQICFVVDSTCQVAFATMPILTLHDLKYAISRNPAVQNTSSLEALGQLQYHPLVRKNFQLNLPFGKDGVSGSKAAAKFPEI